MIQAPVSICLWFRAHAEDAVAFCCSLFPGVRITGQMQGREGPVCPPRLVNSGLLGQSCTAMNGGPGSTLTPAAAIIAMVDGQAGADRLWTAVPANGCGESRSRCCRC